MHFLYIGPGMSGGVIAAILGVLAAIVAGLAGIFWYPLKRLITGKGKKAKASKGFEVSSDSADEKPKSE